MTDQSSRSRSESPTLTLRHRVFRFFFRLALLAVAVPLLVMVMFGLFSSPDHADVIIVPGAALRDGGSKLSNALEWRMETAVELYHDGYAPYLMLSGGGDGEWREAQAMARWAMERGVPEDRIIIDDEGITTRATARNAARIMAQRGWTRALVTSQWYHVPRVRLALMQETVDVSASTCAHPRFLTKEPLFALREIPALYAYVFEIEEDVGRLKSSLVG